MGFGRHLSKVLSAQSLWQQVRLAINPFFFASGGEHSSDHLVDVVRRDPAAASWFIVMTMAFSIVGGAFVCAGCGLFLSLHWDRCCSCNRPLRVWLAGQSLLQVLQLPVRIVLCTSVRAVERAGGSIEACVASITLSPAWRASKVVSLVLYSWFVLGVVWWMNSPSCNSCPGIGPLLLSVLLLSAARALIALAVFQFLFPERNERGHQASLLEPATAVQIAALAVVDVSPADGTQPALGGTTCAVCLADFENGETARKLPCGHHFHKGCIDRWLQRNKRCPLCMHPVDQEFYGHPRVPPKIP